MGKKDKTTPIVYAISSGKWTILGQIKHKPQKFQKSKFFKFSMQDLSPKSSKHHLVTFYVLNNNSSVVR